MDKTAVGEFERLLGQWKTSGQFFADGKILEISGTDTYELALNGHFILHKADVKIGGDASETIEYIKATDGPGSAVMTYFDSNGESGAMTAEI